MKSVNAVQNLLNVLTENNYVNLYQIKNMDNGKCESICYLTKEEAVQHLEYLAQTKQLKKGRYYISETCVYFG